MAKVEQMLCSVLQMLVDPDEASRHARVRDVSHCHRDNSLASLRLHSPCPQLYVHLELILKV